MNLPIATKGLTKVYREGRTEVRAVAGVDLQLKEGEVVGLFGPSGSGKTTLLSILGCLLRPTEGSLQLYGNEVAGMSEKTLPPLRRKHISFIFQGYNLFPALTVFDNVMLGLHVKRQRGGAADKARRVLEEVGLAERMNFLPRDLSGGQKQRASIARALAADAPIILADEPTANLDQVNGRKVMEILRTLAAQRNRCVVVATHDIRISDVFDRIIYMEDGRIVKETRRSS